MSRLLDTLGFHVYDSDRDEWVQFPTTEQAKAYAEELVDPVRTEHYFEAAAPTISAHNTTIVGGNAPVEIVGFNPSRVATRILYVGTGTPLIGTRQGVLAGQGYALIANLPERYEVSASIWAWLPATYSGIIYVFNEEISGPN